jgi:hypothetical protein
MFFTKNSPIKKKVVSNESSVNGIVELNRAIIRYL